VNAPSEVIVPSLLPLWELESLLSLCALIGDVEEVLPEMLRMLKSISRLDFLIGLLAEMVSLRSKVRPFDEGGTLASEGLSVMEARRRRTGEVSVADLREADVAFETEERRGALREESNLSSSILRRSGDGVFWRSPRFSTLSVLALRRCVGPMSTKDELEVGGLSLRGVRIEPPVRDATDSFGLPVERDFAGMARGCVRGVDALREGTETELLLRSREGGKMLDEADLESRAEFPKEGLLLDAGAMMLSSNALTSAGMGIRWTAETACQSAAGIRRVSPDSGLRQQPGQPRLVRPA
jgi:hypothetical protein